jgi:peptidoglycan/LPS O-acetylase OafA/YrhL
MYTLSERIRDMTSLLAWPAALAARERSTPIAELVGSPDRHLRALDGIRGLAVLMVLVFHIFQVEPAPAQSLLRLGYSATRFGQTGVDLFFVLSGFLITGILFDTKKTSRFFINFYGRRALRIFPLYYGVLVVFLLLLPRLVGGPLTHVPYVCFWTFTSNFALTAGAEGGALGHFWSLAIEEQFYLVWPMVVFALSRRALMRVCILSLAAAAILRVWVESQGISSFMLTLCRLDTLLLGAMVALAARSPLGEKDWTRPALLIAVTAFMASLPLCLFMRGSGSAWLAAVKYPLIALFYAAFLVLGITASPRSPSGKVLCSSLLRSLGKYSFGIYVYHPPLIGAIGYMFEILGWNRSPSGAGAGFVLTVKIAAILAASLGAAWLSWNLYEKQFLALKRYFEYGRAPRETPARLIPGAAPAGVTIA